MRSFQELSFDGSRFKGIVEARKLEHHSPHAFKVNCKGS